MVEKEFFYFSMKESENFIPSKREDKEGQMFAFLNDGSLCISKSEKYEELVIVERMDMFNQEPL
jgi:hypothetical protein